MKLKTLFLLTALLSITFLSCDNDDSDSIPVTSDVQKAFNSKYPSARNVKWEDKSGYKVADFRDNDIEASAWFDNAGTWYMTETDIPFNTLPEAVKNSFQTGGYSTWQIDDVDKFEKKDSELVYVIEVEQQEREADLYYAADGILVKIIADSDNNNNQHLPKPIVSELEAFIKEKYPQARIIDIEIETGITEIDIIHNNIVKEVLFDSRNQWFYTSWDVSILALPKKVTDYISNSQYSSYIVDDVDFVETPQSNYYLLELEKGDRETKIKIDENGNILS